MSSETTLPTWWELHLRKARGEGLSETEQQRYEAELAQHDRETPPHVGVEALRQLRSAVTALAQENAQLRERLEKEEQAMSTITLEDAQARLPELIEQVRGGEEIIITRDQKAVARLVPEGKRELPPRKLGTLKGTVRYMAPDFDAPLEDFKDYME